MSVYVVVYHGYDEGDFAIERAFKTREAADAYVASECAGYTSPTMYANDHYEIVEMALT